MKSRTFRTILAIPMLGSLGIAQPITKTGACAPFTRTNANSGDNWGQFPVKPNPLTSFPVGTIQNPLTPQQSANCIEVPEGMKIELFASEANSGTLNPGMHYLQSFSFDERGRLWAVEPRNYPNIIKTASGNTTDAKFTGGDDRILILEDTNGDKVVDNVKVFKDKLNMPQSIEIVGDNVIVTMTPYVVRFKNVNDKAQDDSTKILFSGMGGGNGNYDSHGTISSLMYGLDNWIYGHTGYNTCTVNGQNCGGGRSWRFRHTALGHPSTQFEVWTTGPANAWGIGQMEDGQIFQSGATGTPHINHSIRKGEAAIDIRTGSPNNVFYPITGDRFLWEGQTSTTSGGIYTSTTTAVSGMQFYTSRLFPKKYWSRFAFACEGANKLCNMDSLTPNGSTWRANRLHKTAQKQPNLIAATDAWVAPILAKTGPDGAVWVMDWYNYLFLHNPASPSGPGGAWNNALRTKERSRIWRILPTGATPEPILNLSTATVPQLIAQLGNQNMHWRLQAQRLLVGKKWDAIGAEAGPLLQNILKNYKGVDDVGNNPAVIHAVWTLSGLGRLEADTATWNPLLKALLHHPSEGVRMNVLKALPRTAASGKIISDQCSVNDPNAHVRLQALVAFQEMGNNRPANLPAMSTAFANTDTYSTNAVADAGNYPTNATAGCTITLDSKGEDPVAVAPRAPQPRSDIRIVLSHDGFRLQPHGSLPDGQITVVDPSGRSVFRSTYDARNARWSESSATGLKSQVYIYTFRGADGSLITGRLTPAAGI